MDGLDVGVRGFNTEEQQQELALFINGQSVGQRTQPVPAAGQVERSHWIEVQGLQSWVSCSC